ncbi:MAG: murein biosynthesis integral membrane protein MurJ [Alphaproteobacteria bacterium]|nr:murein biosynthesis integral membrane protein MurJ [Alphaproteobacteria bacterium]
MAFQLGLLVVALILMPWIVRLLAPGFVKHPGQPALATDLARIAFPYLIFTLVAVQLSAMLNGIGRFAAGAAWSIFLNVAMVGTLLWANHFTNAAYAAAWGVLLAGVLQLIFIVVAAARSGLVLRLALPRWTSEAREFLLALGAATIGSASVQISLFIDTLIVSFLPSGDLTALYYADRINQLPMGTLGIALGTVLLPEMSARLAKGDREGADALQNRSASLGLLMTLPFVAAFLAVSGTIMRGLFAHGAFHISAADLSARALQAYGIGLPAFVLVRVVAPTFYARGDTATPVRATVTSVAVNIALKLLFVWGLGLGAVGIALGTALAAWVNVGLLVMLASSRHLLRIDSAFRKSLIPIVLIAVATGAATFLGARYGLPSVARASRFADTLRLAAAIVCGAAALGASTFFAKSALPLGRLARR